MTAEPDQEEQAEVADTNDAPDEVVATGEPEPAAEESMAPVTDHSGLGRSRSAGKHGRSTNDGADRRRGAGIAR